MVRVGLLNFEKLGHFHCAQGRILLIRFSTFICDCKLVASGIYLLLFIYFRLSVLFELLNETTNEFFRKNVHVYFQQIWTYQDEEAYQHPRIHIWDFPSTLGISGTKHHQRKWDLPGLRWWKMWVSTHVSSAMIVMTGDWETHGDP